MVKIGHRSRKGREQVLPHKLCEAARENALGLEKRISGERTKTILAGVNAARVAEIAGCSKKGAGRKFQRGLSRPAGRAATKNAFSGYAPIFGIGNSQGRVFLNDQM